jgi:methionine-rich copper-binding protein CopC
MFRSIIAAFALVLLAAQPAFAHALLRSALPAVGSTVKAAPAELLLVFSESVDPGFSRVEVTDAQGARVDTGTVWTDPADGKRLLVALKPLPAGAYTVTWHATSTDTHKTQGHFLFTVAP